MGFWFINEETVSFWGLVDNVAEGERNCVTGGDNFWVMGWWCVIGLSWLHRHERSAFGVPLLFLFFFTELLSEWERERELLMSWSKMGWLAHCWGFWFLTLFNTGEVDISEVFSFSCFGWCLDFLDRHVWIIFVTNQ